MVLIETDVPRRSHKPCHSSIYEEELKKYIPDIMKSDKCFLVLDKRCNNNNDLRRAIQYVIKAKNYRINVFMKNGEVYIRRIK